jgi:hypothetical protein
VGVEMSETKRRRRPPRVEIWLSGKDETRLNLMCEVLSLSKSAVIRAAMVALSRQLGYERDFHSDFLKEKYQ